MKQEEGRPGFVAGQPQDERSELERLREENRILRMERDFLENAAAFFSKESK